MYRSQKRHTINEHAIPQSSFHTALVLTHGMIQSADMTVAKTMSAECKEQIFTI